MNSEICKKLYSDDIIYHYTKASTAIDFILFKNELRFSDRSFSADPIESSKAKRGTVYYDMLADKPTTPSQIRDSEELHEFVEKLENEFRQICFCKNHIKDNPYRIDYRNFMGKEESFGFSKLRMWDQYADNFSGVCLAFSKNKIISRNQKKFNLIHDDIKYLTFRELSEMKLTDIQGELLETIGKKSYKKIIKEIIKKSFFYKHFDYSGENEYRIGTLFNEKKCGLEKVRDQYKFNQTMILDIQDCIEAIFVSSFANDKQKEELLLYAKEYEIPLLEMKWQHNSFDLIDYKAEMEFVNFCFPPKNKGEFK